MTPPPYPRITGDEPCLTGDPARFFPSTPNGGVGALAECRTCPTRQACFAWAVAHTVEGIWASTENERKAYQREHGIVPRPLHAEPSGQASARWHAGDGGAA